MSDAIVSEFPNYTISEVGILKNRKGKIMKTAISKEGYEYIILRKDGKHVRRLIHRLVATAFLNNEDNLPCVNHKDENPLNNHVENLEWCTHKYNSNYGTAIERRSKAQLNRKDCSKPVCSINKDNEVNFYPSAKQAERELHINNANIIACCRGKRKTTHGLMWRYC